MSITKTRRPLVWINGFPGVGKLTIARELVKFYEQQDVVLIDNHQLIDPVAAKWKRDDPKYYTERRRERLRALGRWVLPAEECQRLVVFTGKLSPTVAVHFRHITHNA
ncbi:putative P-loop containing nucleoside triphosphate hydrolase [Septoria linicola]|nr:putative P-loop containing nucleoside triphosphate hydrolase [Septoria linicola]